MQTAKLFENWTQNNAKNSLKMEISAILDQIPQNEKGIRGYKLGPGYYHRL